MQQEQIQIRDIQQRLGASDDTMRRAFGTTTGSVAVEALRSFLKTKRCASGPWTVEQAETADIWYDELRGVEATNCAEIKAELKKAKAANAQLVELSKRIEAERAGLAEELKRTEITGEQLIETIAIRNDEVKALRAEVIDVRNAYNQCNERGKAEVQHYQEQARQYAQRCDLAEDKLRIAEESIERQDGTITTLEYELSVANAKLATPIKPKISSRIIAGVASLNGWDWIIFASMGLAVYSCVYWLGPVLGSISAFIGVTFYVTTQRILRHPDAFLSSQTGLIVCLFIDAGFGILHFLTYNSVLWEYPAFVFNRGITAITLAISLSAIAYFALIQIDNRRTDGIN